MGDDGIWYVKTMPAEGDARFLFMPLNTPDSVPVCRYVIPFDGLLAEGGARVTLNMLA